MKAARAGQPDAPPVKFHEAGRSAGTTVDESSLPRAGSQHQGNRRTSTATESLLDVLVLKMIPLSGGTSA